MNLNNKIVAEDTAGNEFEKTVEIIEIKGRKILSLGFPYQWDLEIIQNFPPENDILYIDASGRNHLGNTVFCSYVDLIKIIDNIMSE